MTRLVDEIRSAKQRLVLGEKGMLVRVEATSGSAPRDRDAAMLVFA